MLKKKNFVVTLILSGLIAASPLSVFAYDTAGETSFSAGQSGYSEAVNEIPGASYLENQIEQLFDPADYKYLTLRSGVTYDQVQSLKNNADSQGVSEEYSYKINRAMKIVRNQISYENRREFIPERYGDLNVNANNQLLLRWWGANRIPTGLWSNYGRKIAVFVQANENDPLPELRFSQNYSDNTVLWNVQLHRGLNIIDTPNIPENKGAERGGCIYIQNTYTENEQSSNVRIYIDDADEVLVFKQGDNGKTFLNELTEYYLNYKAGNNGYHDVVEFVTKHMVVTIRLERAYEAYIKEGLDPENTVKKCDEFIEYLFRIGGLDPETDMKGQRLHGRCMYINWAVAYATFEFICFQDSDWPRLFLQGNYNWGFAHELGHCLDVNGRTYGEVTNNVWSMHLITDKKRNGDIGVRKTEEVLSWVAPDGATHTWAPDLKDLYMYFDLEVFSSGYWGRVDNMFRGKLSTGSSEADSILKNLTERERFSAYASAATGIDLTYYFERWNFLNNESNDYYRAMNLLNLRKDQPKIWYYDTFANEYGKLSNAGKNGDVKVSSYDASTKMITFDIPASCSDANLGFEIVRDGSVVGFTWNQYFIDSGAGSGSHNYTINAYDRSLNNYASASFSTGSLQSTSAARIGSTYYQSLEQAVENAQNGAEIVLLRSVVVDSTLTVSGKAVTLTTESNNRTLAVYHGRNKTTDVFLVNNGGTLNIKPKDGSKIIFDDNDNQEKRSLFSIHSGSNLYIGKNVVLQNVCIFNKDGLTSGAAVYANQSKVVLDGCIISNVNAYNGTIYIDGGTDLTLKGGTVITCCSADKVASVISSPHADNRIHITDTEISSNFCGYDENGSTIYVPEGEIEIGSGTVIQNNYSDFYNLNSAIYLGASAKATFSGNVNITDNVTVNSAINIDNSLTGKLRLRPDSSKAQVGFVVATSTGSTLSSSAVKALVSGYYNYYLRQNGKTVYITDNNTLVNTSSISATTVQAGETVKITFNSEGGSSDVKYDLSYSLVGYDDWTTITNVNPEKGYIFTTDNAGTFLISVIARDDSGNRNEVTFTLKITAGLKNKTTLSSSSINVGDKVTIKGAATGGKGSYQYSSYYKKSTSSSFSKIRAMSSTATMTFKPDSAGTYTIRTKVKDAAGKISVKDLTLKVVKALKNTTTLSASTINKGEKVTIKGAAIGGKGSYQYSSYYKKSTSSSFSKIRAMSSTATMTFKPDSTGTYTIRTKVKDASGKISVKDLTLKVVKALKNTTTLSASTINKGEKVTIKGAATGGKGSYQYSSYYKKSTSSSFSKIRAMSSTATMTFKPDSTGTYTIRTKVKDASGKISVKDLTLKVVKALKNTTTLSASTINKGEKVTIKGAATGGKGSYQYSSYYKKSTDSSFTRIRAMSSTATMTFKPDSTGTYTIRTKVKDAAGKISVKDLTLKVIKPLKNNSTLSATSITLGKTIKVTGAASGGSGSYTYGVYYKKSSSEKWTTVQSYKTNTTVSIKPAAAVKYRVCVKVKDKTGTIVKKYFDVTVNK